VADGLHARTDGLSSLGVLAGAIGVERVGELRIRWIGHRLHAEAEVAVDEDLTLAVAHRITEDARHHLLHEVPRLASAIIHADPCGHHGIDPHADLEHHDRDRGASGQGPHEH
jgi:divalent metal cation (Fe/Co/Zn/Cd) transporter